jgi:hypothetical protein
VVDQVSDQGQRLAAPPRPLVAGLGVAALAAVLLAVTAAAGPSSPPDDGIAAPAAIPATSAAAPPEPVPPARRASAKLPVIDYGPAPRGFPADPTPLSTAPLADGLHPVRAVAVYDAPGGRPRAFLPPDILGARLTVPIVERRTGWTAVLLPSVNRRIGWVPPLRPGRRAEAWTTVRLRDQLLVVRRTHKLTWLRDGKPVRSWKVSLGTAATPTPLGRTFILGRSALPGQVYAGTDVFALGAVPDDPKAVPFGLRGAHIGVHTWYHDGELGKNTTDGCIRLTRPGQRELLKKVPAGTPVVVVDRAAAPRPVASSSPS